jgi:hypothetical protein
MKFVTKTFPLLQHICQRSQKRNKSNKSYIFTKILNFVFYYELFNNNYLFLLKSNFKFS